METVFHKQTTSHNRSLRRSWITVGFWLLGLALAAVHTWAAIRSGSMNADGIVYLDIGDAYLRGDWQTAVNPVWSPLYSWILGAVMALVQPPVAWEFAVVHLVNLAIFVVTFLCFEFFWRELGSHRKQALTAGGQSLPDWAWLAVGYALFIWMALEQIAIWAVTPDMLMAGFVLVASGLIVRIRAGHDSLLTFILLGLALGLGYLAKAIMFPLAFVFLAIALFSAGQIRRTAPRAALALFLFLLVSLPFIAAISSSHGRVTFGEAGTITYLRYVNGIPYPHWQGEGGNFGTPIHPSRQIFSNPPIYEFGEPIGGTYPISTNPIYWYEGAAVQFDLAKQLRAVLSNAFYFLDLFARRQGGLAAGVVLLYIVRGRQFSSASGAEAPTTNLRTFFRRWGLMPPALAAFFVYSLVHVEGRYVGVFVLLFWSELLANARVPDSPPAPKIVQAVSVVMAGFMLANLVAFNLEGYGRLAEAGGAALQEEAPPARATEVALALRRLEVPASSRVGVIGYGFDSYWARLARVKIVAEMFEWEAEPFWLGDDAQQEAVLAAFAGTGACAVVAEYVPSYARLPGWQQVGASNYYIYLLARC